MAENNPLEQNQALLEGVQYTPVVQQYAINQTGNIFISMSEGLTEEARADFARICSEVSVFFASLTKAVSSVTNPKTGKPYSIYNYEALNRVISNSNMFVPLQSQDYIFISSLSGAELAEELMQTILSVKLPKEDLGFATETLNSMATEDSEGDDDSDTRAANIVFKCESMMGMPMVTVIVANFYDYDEDDEDEGEDGPEKVISEKSSVKSISTSKKTKRRRRRRGPLLRLIKRKKKSSASKKPEPEPEPELNDWRFQKETYLFIPPKHFQKYALDTSYLNSQEYLQLVNYLADKLEDDDDPAEEGPIS